MKRKWIIIGGAAVVVALIVYFSLASKSKSPFETVTVTRGNISEEVSVTGNVEPVQSVDLAFEQAGKILSVNAKVGDTVYVGETLVRLDASVLNAQLSKAEADLAGQQADVAKAKVDLANYYGSIPNLLNDAYAKTDDAVRKQLDSLFNNPESQNPTLTFTTTDINIDNDVRRLRLAATGILNQWARELAGLSSASSNSDLGNELKQSEGYLMTIRALLSRAMEAVVNAANTTSLSSSLADTYKKNIDTGRTEVATAIANLTDQEQSIVAEEAQIASLEAGVKSDEAAVQNIKAQISKTIIVSPLNGIVTVQNAKVGEIAAANAVVTSVISANKFDVEANVAEADIAKVKIGDKAEITLDAYGSKVVFEASVSSIDPAEKLVEGVATYLTKFQFAESDSRPKAGMTANITIFTNKRENVLVIPQRVVTTKDGQSTVLLDLGGGRSEERTIETGLKGVDGNVEVIQGLQEDERVIIKSS